MEQLLSFLNSIAEAEGWPLSEACLAHLKRVTKKTTLRKAEYLLSAGKVCKNLYFIRSGLLKCYYLVHNQEVVDWFFGEMQTVVAIDSFYDQVPSEDFIQAIKDCVAFYVTFEELNELYRTYVEFNVVGRVLTNKYLRIWHRQARNIRKLTAEERYRLVLETQPELVNQVDVGELASFLGISREHLSRIRGRLL